MRAYRLTGEAKVQGCTEFIETLIENGAKFLVFGHHKSVLDHLENFVKKKRVGYVRIDGSVPVEKRHNRV